MCSDSDVMNWHTSDVLPTPAAPNMAMRNGWVMPGQLAQLDSLEDANDVPALVLAEPG